MNKYIEDVKKYFIKFYLFHNPFNGASYIEEKLIDKIGRVTYLYEQVLDKTANYILQKRNIDYKILEPPILYNHNVKKTDLSELVQMHNEQVLNFINVVENVFPKEVLTSLYSNLKNITIDVSDYSKSSTIGTYSLIKNSILLDKSLNDEELKNTIYHELFHMASTTKHNNITYCGFDYCGTGYSIGKAINEGYTEIMTKRYFLENDYFVSGYYKEMNYASAIEDIVGKEIMEKFYITGNLHGLIESLKKYASEKEIIDFLMKADKLLLNEYISDKNLYRYRKISTYKEEKKIDMQKEEMELNLFLASLKLKKNNEEDLASKLLNQDMYSDLYTSNGEIIGKNIYIKCLELFNGNPNEDNLNYLFDAIGYDKLKEICFTSGIPGLINELKKYSTPEDIDTYIKLLDADLSDEYNSTIARKINDYRTVFSDFPLSICIIKNGLPNNQNLKAKITSGFRLNDDYSYGTTSNFIYAYNFLLESRVKSNFKDDNLQSRIIGVENLVGKEEMLKLFILGDLDGVCKKLSKYASEDDIYELINSNNFYASDEFLDKINNNNQNIVK